MDEILRVSGAEIVIFYNIKYNPLGKYNSLGSPPKRDIFHDRPGQYLYNKEFIL